MTSEQTMTAGNETRPAEESADYVDRTSVHRDPPTASNVTTTSTADVNPRLPSIQSKSRENTHSQYQASSALHSQSQSSSPAQEDLRAQPEPHFHPNAGLFTPISSPLQAGGLQAADGTYSSPYLHYTHRQFPKETHVAELDIDPISGRKVINQYEIIDELGRGVHGKVKLARNLVDGTHVAIKIVERYSKRRRLGKNNSHESRVKQEIAILKKARHPNIVELLEVIDDPVMKKVYMVLEHVEMGEIQWRTEGTTDICFAEYRRCKLGATDSSVKDAALQEDEHIDQVPEHFRYVPLMSLDEVRQVFRDTVLGLEYLHYQGIVHRDIKPANLLQTADDRIKISDFAVSYLDTSFDPALEAEGLEAAEIVELAKTVGTPAFYAPEICQREYDPDTFTLPVTHLIDNWALGVTLYCLVYGRVPLHDENIFILMRLIAEPDVYIPNKRLKAVDLQANSLHSSSHGYTWSTPIAANKRRSHELLYEDVDDDLRDLLKRMLTKDPRHRITLNEVKHHPWLLQGIIDNVRWLEMTDPRRNTTGRRIEISKEDVGDAVVPLTIVERAKSVAQRVAGIFGISSQSQTRTSAESSATNSADRNNPNSATSSSSSTNFQATPQQQGRRRPSLKADDTIFAGLRASRDIRHPLAQSAAASPEERGDFEFFSDPDFMPALPSTPLDTNAQSNPFSERHSAVKLDSDSDIVSELSDVPSTISATGSYASTSSVGSMAIVFSKASEQFADVLGTDPELQILYPEALHKFGNEKFSRNHDRLLKKYFNDLRLETQQPLQVETIRLLRQHHRRSQVTDLICRLLDPSNFAKYQAVEMLQKQKPDRQYVLNSALKAQSFETQSLEAQSLQPYGIVDDDAREEDKSSSEDDLSDGGLDDDKLYSGKFPQLDGMVVFLTEGTPFHRFKASLRRFVHPPTTLEEALSYRDLEFLEKFLEKEFDAVAEEEYAWIGELEDVGYTRDEIAQILLEQSNDAPWIYFEPQQHEDHMIIDDLHLDYCVHRGDFGDPFPDSSSALSKPPTLPDEMEIRRSVQELCGLAGIAPTSRDSGSWNGHVRFKDENSAAIVSYALPGDERNTACSAVAARICRVLKTFRNAVGLVQAAGFCCNSFTVLVQSPHDTENEEQKSAQVELWRVELKHVVQLYAQVLELCIPSRLIASGAVDTPSMISHILPPLLLDVAGIASDASISHALHLSSLTAQFLCLGFLSYIQAHIPPLQPFFLDTPQRSILLLGNQELEGNRAAISANFRDLTCAAGMTQGPVLTFAMVSTKGDDPPAWQESPKYDLLASAEDLLDTWGPGQLIRHKDCRDAPCAILIAGGIVYSDDRDGSSFHWGSSVDIDDMHQVSFDPRMKLSIGALVTVNTRCIIDEKHCFLNSCSALKPLGTFGDHWRLSERQAGLQAGQYVVGQFNQTWQKIQGKTLKQFYLEQEDDILLTFLEAPWGLQVSFCTSVARRVLLRELVADMLPIFANTLLVEPQLWQEISMSYDITEELRKDGIRNWLKIIAPDFRAYIMHLIRRILTILQFTGVDRDGRYLTVGWPQEGDLQRCFKIPCEDKSFWARMLADSEDCATFAYISSKCLESETVKCNGPTPMWRNVSTILETAVIHHQSIPSTIPKTLVHKKAYFIKKTDSLFIVKVHRPEGMDSACLIASPSRMRLAIQHRLFMKEERKQNCILRERQALYEPAEQVVVLAAGATN